MHSKKHHLSLAIIIFFLTACATPLPKDFNPDNAPEKGVLILGVKKLGSYTKFVSVGIHPLDTESAALKRDQKTIFFKREKKLANYLIAAKEDYLAYELLAVPPGDYAFTQINTQSQLSTINIYTYCLGNKTFRFHINPGEVKYLLDVQVEEHLGNISHNTHNAVSFTRSNTSEIIKGISDYIHIANRDISATSLEDYSFQKTSTSSKCL